MANHVIYRLEKVECRTEKTIEGYKQAFKILSEIYGEDYSIHKIDRTAIWQIKGHLREKRNRPATINTYLRKLRAAFERVNIDGVLDRNPFYKFEPLFEPKDKQKAFTYDELKRLLKVIDEHPNEKLRRLLRISIYTGLRRSEVLLIKREDVNLSERFFYAVNIKSRDRHKVWRELPEKV